MKCTVNTEISFEQYVAWAASRYPGYHAEEPLTEVEASVYSATESPVSSDACPVTVKSNQNGYVVVTPRPQRSR